MVLGGDAPVDMADFLAALPDTWPEDVMPEVRRLVGETGRKLVVLDDDPTGGQTVHGLWVLTRWSPDVLRPALADDRPVFFILTNSRGLAGDRAEALDREIAGCLADAAEGLGCDFDVLIRGDSTLRGHYPLELDAVRSVLTSRLGWRYDGTIICPFFLEGGRLTAGDVHWVTEGDQVVPAAQTEFARDATFGYAASNLREWVAEKTQGRAPASEVLTVSLETIRGKGPEGVRKALLEVGDGRVVAVNAVTYGDMAVFVAGLLAAQAEGKRFLFRTAASFVKVRAGVTDRGLLTTAELSRPGETGGLVLVGSYVQKTSRQLQEALKLPGLEGVELRVARVLDASARAAEIARVAQTANRTLTAGQEAVIYTSRELVTDRGRAGDLDIGQEISSALVDVVRQIEATPRFVIAKGGNTSSHVAVDGLGVERAWIMGQILPGVPVWRLEAESRFPGMPLVVFPGNVGTDDSVAQAIRTFRG